MDQTLASLGKLITGTPSRDAVHIAVAPVIAARDIKPGTHVGFAEAGNTERVTPLAETPIGIIDPYLSEPVRAGQRCWLFLYPQTITSLKHLWTHPAFEPVESPRDASIAWIKEYAESSGQSYRGLMAAAKQWVQDNEYTYDNTESYKDGRYYADLVEFWRHYEIVTGVKVDDPTESFFTCAC